ncbi:glycoside hydrolase family 18 protein [Streptomyces buecherae]|uniref:hypothetical protein n=1 Tax=Streptomyces buecherae TaxID=2763006 RepID=UPI00364CE37D
MAELCMRIGRLDLGLPPQAIADAVRSVEKSRNGQLRLLWALEDVPGLLTGDGADEYADYPENGPDQVNAWSFPYLVDALRERLSREEGKFISLYFIGPSSETLVYDGIDVGTLLDYRWNPWYGSFNPPAAPGLTKEQLAAASIDIADEETGGWVEAADLARQTKKQGYGVYNTYRLPDTDVSNGPSAVTKILYSHDVRYIGTPGAAP